SEIFRVKMLSMFFVLAFGVARAEDSGIVVPGAPQANSQASGLPSAPVAAGERRQMTAEEKAKFKPFESRFMRKAQQKSADEKLRDVSKMYEKHFLREMLKGMRSTVHEGGFVQANNAEKIFKEQLDEQYVEKWGERGGIGLSDMIYKQLVDKFGVAMGIKSAVTKPAGPLPLDAKSEYRAHQFRHPGKKQALSYRIDSAVAGSAGVPEGTQAGADPKKGEAVKAPWDGVLMGKRTLADNQTMFEIKHDNGLKSQVVFKGGSASVSEGQKLQAGDTLGFLSSEAKSLYWTVEPGPDTASE
ncbi:MAG TPA: rod-binding protein, partial [Bdellovibrio sp.]